MQFGNYAAPDINRQMNIAEIKQMSYLLYSLKFIQQIHP